MLFDLEDFLTTGWIGYGSGFRYPSDERTIANSGDIEDWATTFRAVRDAHIGAVNQRALTSIRVLPIEGNKRTIAVQKYFAWMDSIRDFHLYNTEYNNNIFKFPSMLNSIRFIFVEGGVTFNEGDVVKLVNVSELTEEELATLPKFRVPQSQNNGELADYRVKSAEDGWMVYVPFNQVWIDGYFAKFDAVVEAEKQLIIATEGLTENYELYVAPVIPPVVKFKHAVNEGGTFDGTVKTTTGFVKFILGKTEFILGSTGSTSGNVDFSFPVTATSKKSGSFYSCDANGEISGDILEVVMNSTMSSLNVSNAVELTKLVSSNGSFGSLSLSKNTKLTYLDVRNNTSLTSLNVSGLNLLEEIYCQGCSIGTLNLTGANNLVRIEAQNNKLTGVNLSGLDLLTYVNFGNNSFMPSSRGPLLIELDLSGSTGGTLIAPLEGRNSNSDAAYASLISKGWTLTSDGVALPKGIYGSSIHGESFGGWFLTTTGYYKIVSSKGVLIKGGSQFAIDENSNYYTLMHDLSVRSSPWGDYVLDYSLQAFDIPGGCPDGYSIHPCDVDGNVTGDICGFEISQNDKFEALDLDLSKIEVININYCMVENLESFLNQIPQSFDIDMYSSYSTNGYVLDISGMNLRRFRTGYAINNLAIKGLDSLNLTALELTSVRLKSTTGVTGIYDLSNMTNLKGCYIGLSWIDESITGFNLSGLSNLDTNIAIYGTYGIDNNIQSIDVSDCTSITGLNLGGFTPINGSVSLNLDNTPLMTQLYIQGVRLSADSSSYYEFTPKSSITNLGIYDVPKLKINTGSSLSELWLGGQTTHIMIENQPSINRLGIDNAYYLQELNIVSPLTNLRYFNGIAIARDIQNGIILDISKMPNIIEFATSNWTKINQLNNISSATQLLRCYLSNTRQSNLPINLDFSSCTELNQLVLSGCDFSGSLNVANTKLSGGLSLNNTQFTSVDVSNTNLSSLYLNYSKATTVNITNTGTGNASFSLWGQNARELTSIIGANNNPKLWRIDLSNSKVTSLDVSNSEYLNTLYCAYNSQLTSITATNMTGLDFFNCTTNASLNSVSIQGKFTYIDLTNSTSLVSLNVSNTSNLYQLQVNGSINMTTLTGIQNKTNLHLLGANSTNISSFDFTGCTNIKYVYLAWIPLTPSATDNVYIQLAPIMKNNGQLGIRNNRTSTSDSARQTLLNKGVSISTFNV